MRILMLTSIRHDGAHLETGHAYDVEDKAAQAYVGQRIAVVAPLASHAQASEPEMVETREPVVERRDPKFGRRR